MQYVIVFLYHDDVFDHIEYHWFIQLYIFFLRNWKSWVTRFSRILRYLRWIIRQVPSTLSNTWRLDSPAVPVYNVTQGLHVNDISHHILVRTMFTVVSPQYAADRQNKKAF